MVKVQSSLAKRLICRVGSTTIPSGYASLGVAASSARSQRRHCRVIGACRLYASESGRQTRQPVCRLRAKGKHRPTHSITSSASCWRCRETSRPKALAALRLIVSSKVVGRCTGRSAGFSPLRMRSTYVAARRYLPALLATYEIRPPDSVK